MAVCAVVNDVANDCQKCCKLPSKLLVVYRFLAAEVYMKCKSNVQQPDVLAQQYSIFHINIIYCITLKVSKKTDYSSGPHLS